MFVYEFVCLCMYVCISFVFGQKAVNDFVQAADLLCQVSAHFVKKITDITNWLIVVLKITNEKVNIKNRLKSNNALFP